MATKKYYAVQKGRVPGIFKTWEECKKQVDGYPGAIYKSFPTLEAAETYLSGAADTPSPDGESVGRQIYVDGSFNKGKKRYSWAYVVYEDGQLIFSDSGVGDNAEAAAIHNVAGELAATMRAVKWAAGNNFLPVTIHHDYMGIAAWATGAWKANNKFTQAYAAFIAPFAKSVRFIKVKGHSGVEGNEMADRLAGEAMARSDAPPAAE